jgi:hypothetical protein
MTKKWAEIIKSEEDSINFEIVRWAGIDQLWEDNYELLSNCNLIQDIMPFCEAAEINQEEYDCEFPGRSGILYSIETNNPEILKHEIRQLVGDIISPRDNNVNVSSQIQSSPTVDEIVDILMGEAAGVRNLRAPAGYQGMAEQSAREMEAAAKLLLENNKSLEDAVVILSNLILKIRVSSSKSRIDGIIKGLEQR